MRFPPSPVVLFIWAVLNTIRARYANDDIYTYSGIVLTSVNPYRELDIYDPQVVWAYHEKRVEDLSPHLYAIAEKARSSLLHKSSQDQTIIISGESGAGKTISAKYIMRYLAEVCSATDRNQFTLEGEQNASPTVATQEHSIEASILATNPILEAFGNAKTARNDNSSRFGKYIQIYYNDRGKMSGARIQTYLLEKTRVVGHAVHERGFHIFYQLLASGTQDWRLAGRSPTDFAYLSKGETAIKNVDDCQEFAHTKRSLLIAGIDEAQQRDIFRLLAAILYLGNIDFASDAPNEPARLASDGSLKALQAAAELLGVPDSELQRSLLLRTITAGGDSVQSPNDVEHAGAVRDAMAKLIYSTLFEHVVERLNERLRPRDADQGRFIGVLDIYGFEKFEQNHFEQFCINYANEKLQSLFTKQMFKLEQELYAKEGLNWSFVEFYDNQRCIDLIEGKLGILELLDEECRFPNGSDSTFLSKLLANHPPQQQQQQHHSSPLPIIISTDKLAPHENFTVGHFAYTVRYTVEGILEKNRDTVSGDLLHALSLASIPLIQSASAVRLCEQAKSREETPRKRQLTGRGGSTQATTGVAFKNSLDSLLSILASTQIHYIRCIKPNETKQPAAFDPSFVLQQLRACGVLETIRISAAGYPGRWKFSEFLQRFSLLLRSPIPSNGSVNDGELDLGCHERDLCCRLLEGLKLPRDSYQVGKSKIFMRSGVLAAIEERRLERLQLGALEIQSVWRCSHVVALVARARAASLRLQMALRSQHARALVALARREKAVGLVIGSLAAYWARRDRRLCRIALQGILGSWLRYQLCRLLARQRDQRASFAITGFFKMAVARKLYCLSQRLAAGCRRALLRKQSLQTLTVLRIEARSIDGIKATADQLRDQTESLAALLRETELALASEKLRNRDLVTQLTATSEEHARRQAQESQATQKLVESLEQGNQRLFAKNQQLEEQLKEQRICFEASIKDLEAQLERAAAIENGAASRTTSQIVVPSRLASPSDLCAYRVRKRLIVAHPLTLTLC